MDKQNTYRELDCQDRYGVTRKHKSNVAGMHGRLLIVIIIRRQIQMSMGVIMTHRENEISEMERGDFP